jgi:hemerythrin-like domain-containing protein
MLKEMFGMAEGILQDLHNDHQEVAKLIDTIMESEDSRQRAAVFKEMMTKLLAHSKAEAAVLYAPMKKSDDEDVRSFALEGENEHTHVEIQLKDMARATTKTTEQWTAKLTVLKELVEHHVDEEESTGFKCARAEFDKATLEKMGTQFERLKKREMAAT